MHRPPFALRFLRTCCSHKWNSFLLETASHCFNLTLVIKEIEGNCASSLELLINYNRKIVSFAYNFCYRSMGDSKKSHLHQDNTYEGLGAKTGHILDAKTKQSRFSRDLINVIGANNRQKIALVCNRQWHLALIFADLASLPIKSKMLLCLEAQQKCALFLSRGHHIYVDGICL